MKASRLDLLWRDGVAFDLETHLLQPGLLAPPVVCGSIASVQHGTIVGSVGARDEAAAAFDAILADPRYTLCGAKIDFDVICQIVDHAARGIDIAPAVFAMYDPTRGAVRGDVDGRVIDVQTFEKLHAIAYGMLGLDPATGKKIINPETGKQGRYSLATVVQQVLGRDNAKVNSRFKGSYALFENIPIEQWPFEARTYPVDDAVNTFEAALAQAGHIDNIGPHMWNGTTCAHCGEPPGTNARCRSRYRRSNSHDLSRQVYMALCLALGAAWGFKVNQDTVNALEAKYIAEHAGRLQPFVDGGIIRADGTENQAALKRLVLVAYLSGRPLIACEQCTGTGKVPSVKTAGKTKINCGACDGSRAALPTEVPRTEGGGIGISRDALQESGDEFLMSYADYDEGKKIPKVYIPYLRCTDRNKVPHPGVPRTLSPNEIVETGRVSYDGATMLLPRTGGVRECIEARPGYVLSSEDFKAGELVTHAQSCLWIVGASKLAEALNLGLDAHLALAGTIIGKPYDEMKRLKKAGDQHVVHTRQVSKPPNFGFPGRMGAAKLVQQQRKQNDVHTPHPTGPTWLDDGHGGKVRGYKGLRFCLLMGKADRCGEVKVTEWKGRPYPPLCKKCIECAEELRKAWLLQWPENVAYFAHVKAVDESGAPVVQHVTKRLRGFRHGQVDEDGQPINAGNAIANGYFQALLADAAKDAYMAATRECYDRTVRVESFTKHTSAYEGLESPLYGSRLPTFQHDEIVGEHPISVAHEAATRVSELMCESLRIKCPDLERAVEAEPCLMLKLYKGAQTTRDANGRLIPWEP